MNILPYIITAASILGTVANSLQKRWCFYVWLYTNSFWVVYNAINGSYAQALLYAFNFAMAILGLIKWKKKKPPDSTERRPTVHEVNKALKINLTKWQIEYIFGDGEYHSEAVFGRVNGKTLANVLKLITSSGPPLILDERNRVFRNAIPEEYAKEDAISRRRSEHFIQETRKVYKMLHEAGVKNLRKIVNEHGVEIWKE